MASKTRTKAKTRTAPPRRRPAPAGVGRLWWGAGAAVTLVAAVVVAWVAAGGDDQPVAGAPVEQFSHVHGMAIPAWQPQTVYVSTHEGLIHIDEQGWSYASGQSHDFMGFAAHPTRPDTLYTSGHPAPGAEIANPVGFMVSTDGGASWQVRSLEGEADFHALAVGAAGNVIYGWDVTGQVGLFRSTDGGRTWAPLAVPAAFVAGGVFALAAHPEDPDLLWAATDAGLLHSRDGAASWETMLSGGPVTAVTTDPSDPERILAYAALPGDGLLESHDGGQTWTPTGWRLEAGDDAVGQLAIHPDDPRISYAATFGRDLLRSGDGGRTWQPVARAGTPDQ
jgi:photosystem II stability/assembly factor-like uncharacterized protein